MKKYLKPQTIEILFTFDNVIALSNINEEGEGEYSRKQEEEPRTYGFGTPMWSDLN
jgi:hypothetical protein